MEIKSEDQARSVKSSLNEVWKFKTHKPSKLEGDCSNYLRFFLKYSIWKQEVTFISELLFRNRLLEKAIWEIEANHNQSFKVNWLLFPWTLFALINLILIKVAAKVVYNFQILNYLLLIWVQLRNERSFSSILSTITALL